MSSKQSLRLSIDLAKRLNAYLRAASAQAARGRLDTAPTNLPGHREAFELESNTATRLLAASPPERDEEPGRPPAPAQAPNGGDCHCS
jgi:hypothetical protein